MAFRMWICSVALHARVLRVEVTSRTDVLNGKQFGTAGPYERIELSHRAEDRMIFAHGALKAAMWAQGKKPGLYSMADVLGLSGF